MVGKAARERILERLRTICLVLPETSERLSHGAPTFFVREKRPFLMVLTDHHGDDRFAIWCAAPAGVQGLLVENDTEKFFVPPYVGHRGWLGVRLDAVIDWDELTGHRGGRVCRDRPREARRGGADARRPSRAMRKETALLTQTHPRMLSYVHLSERREVP